MIIAQSEALMFFGPQFGMLGTRLDVVSRILFAIDRSNMWRVAIAIRSPDSKFFVVGINPFPQLLGGNPALCARLALYADDIGRQTVTITAAEAPAMIGPVGFGLLARRDDLPIIVAKSARYAWDQTGLVKRAQGVIERDPEIRVHAANNVIGGRHPGSCGGLWILPGEIL